jgi:hypothetical protein
MTVTVEDVLAHHGIKGQKWGVRRALRSRGQRVRETASPDAKAAGDAYAKLKKGGIHTLSNAELQSIVNRMNLEQQYVRIAPQSKKVRFLKAGGKFTGDVLVSVGKAQATKLATDHATKLIGLALKSTKK